MSTTPPPDTSERRPAARVLAALQGAFYLGTGVWPLVHVDSFQAVTGPKADLWQVYTVGALVAVVGLVLLSAARAGRPTPEVALLAAGTALALAAIDVVFVTRGVIDRVYLLDAVVEVGLAVGWACVARPAPRPRPYPG